MQMAQVVGRLLAGRRRPVAPRDGQEEARGWPSTRDLPRGAAERGVDAGKADEIFDLMEKFAGYGFNKSHSAAYAWSPTRPHG